MPYGGVLVKYRVDRKPENFQQKIKKQRKAVVAEGNAWTN
jgi:hypothetical protein